MLEELRSIQLPDRAGRYRLESRDGATVAVEVRRDLINPDARIFVTEMRDHTTIPEDVTSAIQRIGGPGIIKVGMPVAIKVNLGGGVARVPSSFSDPLVVEGAIDAVRAFGGRPFVCEADMRSVTMTQGVLARRSLYAVLTRKDVPFVNLSGLPGIDFFPLGWRRPLNLPVALLHPDVGVISVPALKHHWECGVTLAGKNMYGAIAERQKSLFHRGGAIDETVAAAVRAVTPDISLLAHRQVGGGLGPHFCIPVDFGYVVASNNVLAADRFGCGFMGTDWRKVKHIQINTGGREVPCDVLEGSVEIERPTVDRIARTAISRPAMWAWRALLYPQYFVPHGAQYRQIPKLEPLGTRANWLLYHSRGDDWPSKWRARRRP